MKKPSMARSLLTFLFCFSCCFSYADENDLLRDYQLLYIDLLNRKTWGYKSYFNSELNRSDAAINITQGALFLTEEKLMFLLRGKAFLRSGLKTD